MTETVYYTDFADLDSSVLRFAVYDADTQRLWVRFKDTNRTAGYGGVPRYVYNGLKAAPSAGSYYNRNIKNYYKGVSSDITFVPKNPKPRTVPTVPTPATQTSVRREYVVTYETLVRQEVTVAASSLEDALRQVKGDGKNIISVTLEG